MIVELNPAEQKLAQYIAKCRYWANRKNGVVDQKVGAQGNWATDLEGVGAEIAFAKHSNTYPDLEIGNHDDADVFTVGMGGVDVKATKYRNGRLLARTNKSGKPPDAYALMVGEFPRYKFVGWVPADELLDDQNLIDLGYGKTYGVGQERLKGEVTA